MDLQAFINNVFVAEKWLELYKFLDQMELAPVIQA